MGLVLVGERGVRLVVVLFEDGAERHVNDLPGVMVVEEVREGVVGDVRDAFHPAVEVVTLAVLGVAFHGQVQNPAEQARRMTRNHAQGLQPTGAGGFDVDVFRRAPLDVRVDGQFVAAGMHAQFVGPQFFRNGGVRSVVPGERLRISRIIHALVEIADEPGRQPDKRNAKPIKFQRNVSMLGGGGGGIRFVHRYFQVERGGAEPAAQVRMEPDYARNGRAIFARRPEQGFFGKRAVRLRPGGVPLKMAPRVAPQDVPGQFRKAIPERGGVLRIRGGAHVLPRVQRKSDESRVDAPVYFRLGLDMVCVAAVAVPIAGFEHGPGYVVQDLLRAAAGARHFAHGLLREDRKKSAFRQVGERVEVSGRGEAQPVPETERFAQSDKLRGRPGERFPNERGVAGMERAVRAVRGGRALESVRQVSGNAQQAFVPASDDGKDVGHGICEGLRAFGPAYRLSAYHVSDRSGRGCRVCQGVPRRSHIAARVSMRSRATPRMNASSAAPSRATPSFQTA